MHVLLKMKKVIVNDRDVRNRSISIRSVDKCYRPFIQTISPTVCTSTEIRSVSYDEFGMHVL